MTVVAFGWVAAWIAASVIYRTRVGKPLFPNLPRDAIYSERSASAPFASRCLLVAVTDEQVTIAPGFPFNLMFLPEIYGLEQRIPLDSISEIKAQNGFLIAHNVVLIYGPERKRLRLRVKRPDEFVSAVRGVI